MSRAGRPSERRRHDQERFDARLREADAQAWDLLKEFGLDAERFTGREIAEL